MRRFSTLAAAIVAVLAATFSAPAKAGLEDALARFAADSYAETEIAIGEVARSGDPRAAEIVQALADGRLLYAADRRVFVRDRSDALLDAATGQPVAGERSAGLKPVRVNN